MHLPISAGLLAASACLMATAASGALVKSVRPDPSSLRLIKTNFDDPGTWLSEAEINDYAERKVQFVDITDITDEELTLLSTNFTVARRQTAQAYPSSVTHQTQANALIAKVTNTGPQSWMTTLTNFQNRYYTSSYGLSANTWLLNQATTLAAANPTITVTQFTHSGFSQKSIIVTIPGTTTTDLVIVGAHYDGVGGNTARRPAADDNASGTVVLLEALRVLASERFAPRDTLQFHFYAAEEVGLRGSRDVFASLKSQGRRVLGFVNQDMAGYSPSGRLSIYNDFVDAAFTAYVRLVGAAYSGSTPSSDSCGYGCSDHASAYSNGFPAAYVCDEVMATSSPYIHTEQDALSTIQWPAILRHSKFTVGFLVEASYLT